MTIDEKMIMAVNEIVTEFGKHEMTRAELCALLTEKYQVTEGSVIPSDYCYNLVNDGIDPDKKPMLFIHMDKGVYLCVGEHYPYDGPVTHNGKVVGKCRDGVRVLYSK